jgi:hypothetical protein
MTQRSGSAAMPLPPALPRRLPYRTAGVSALIFALIALFVGGLTAWNDSVPGGRNIAPGLELEVGKGVYYQPAEQWRLDAARSRTGSISAIFRGANRFTIRVQEWRGGPEGPLTRQLARLERGQGLQIEGDPEPFRTRSGLAGMSFAYYGANAAGRYWQITNVERQLVIQVDFRSVPEGAENSLDEAEAMVDTLRLEARP